MRIHGKKIEGVNIETIVLPRGEGDPIVIKAQAVLDYKEFHELCPVPKAPTKMLKGGRKVPDFEDKNYTAHIESYSQKKTQWMVLQSLKATEGLTWDTIDMKDSNTWGNIDQEMKESGFSEVEIQRITMGIMSANCLNEEKLQEARDRFLASQLVHIKSSSNQEEPLNTLSGKVASGLESRPPGIKENWSDMDVMAQANLLAYNQIREIEEMEEKVEMVKAMHPGI